MYTSSSPSSTNDNLECKILFTSKGILLNNNISINSFKSFIYLELKLSNKFIKSLTISYKHEDEYVSTILNKSVLNPLNYSIINNLDDSHHSNLWIKLQHHINSFPPNLINSINDTYTSYNNIQQGFLIGFVSYISLIFLLDKSKFINILPFKFYIPCTLENGDCCEFNILQYILLPINTIIDLIDTNTLLYTYFSTISSFITLWSPIFHIGPSLNPIIFTKLTTSILTGITKYSINKFNLHLSQSSYICENCLLNSTQPICPLNNHPKSINTSHNFNTHTTSDYNTTSDYKTTSNCKTSDDSRIPEEILGESICIDSFDEPLYDLKLMNHIHTILENYHIDIKNNIYKNIESYMENIGNTYILYEIERHEMMRQKAFADNLASYTKINKSCNDNDNEGDIIKNILNKYMKSRIPDVKSTIGFKY